MSGIYNYHPKVNHPNEIFPQMESGGFQPHFFFGGSQVPNALGIKGNGFNTKHIISTRQPTIRLGLKRQNTYHEKHKNIHHPRRLMSATGF